MPFVTSRETDEPGLAIGNFRELTILVDLVPGGADHIRELVNEIPEEPFYKVGTIHTARFVLLDNDTRLLIATEFDGSWDAYMEDFANPDKLGPMFDRTYIYAEGFPGTSDVEAFKQWHIEHQITAGWFWAAYPEHTVKDIERLGKMKDVVDQALELAQT